MKRFIDILIAGILLVVLLPVMVVTAVLVRILLGKPVLFRQQRPGLHGRPFMLKKFRSMSDERDADGNLLPDGSRLGRFGKTLRRTSLDELPQLWNVLVGDMSLVGPRPLLMAYLGRYSSRQARRHEVRPGITGWAQINGRNTVSWSARLEMDVWYVDNRSMWLDLKILALTACRVMRSRDVSAAGHATMPEFMGGPEEEQ